MYYVHGCRVLKNTAVWPSTVSGRELWDAQGRSGGKGERRRIPTLKVRMTDTPKPTLWECPSLTEVGQLFPILTGQTQAWAGLSRRVSRFKDFAGGLGIGDVAHR